MESLTFANLHTFIFILRSWTPEVFLGVHGPPDGNHCVRRNWPACKKGERHGMLGVKITMTELYLSLGSLNLDLHAPLGKFPSDTCSIIVTLQYEEVFNEM